MTIKTDRRPLSANERMRRNLSPHRAAVMAMCLFGSRYAAQNGGSMDFWDSLSPSEQNRCRDAVRRIEQARHELEQPDAE